MLKAAEQWWKRGYTPIPIAFRDKRPTIKWSGYVGHRPCLTTVKRWWKPLRNVGVLLEHGLVAVDFDEEGFYDKWYQETGFDTYTVKTARGHHAYFRLNNHMGFSLKMVGGDIKATGLMIVPPSIHPSGIKYKVVNVAPIMSVVDIDSLHVELIKADFPEMAVKSEIFKGDGVIAKIKNTIDMREVLSGFVNEGYSTSNGKIMVKCPLHSDSNPSMVVDLTTNRCFCFAPGCKANGKYLDVIDMYGALRNMNQTDTIKAMAGRYGV